MQSTLSNISESTVSLRGTLNEFGYPKLSIFRNDEENNSESNERRNIDFDLKVMMNSAIISQNEIRDGLEKTV